MIGRPEDTSSIDVSVAFFAAVLALITFVAFSVAREPSDETDETLGQTWSTVDISPPGWNAVPARGQFAVYSSSVLVLIDLSDFLRASIDPSYVGVNEDTNYAQLRSGRENSPRALDLSIVTTPDNFPEKWRRDMVQIQEGNSAECMVSYDLRRPIFIYVPKDESDVAPLLRYLSSCNFRAVIRPSEALRPDGTTMIRLRLGSSSFSEQALFR